MGQRVFRELNAETKNKISRAMKGKKKSETHKQAIAKSMKLYWLTIPHKDLSTDYDAESASSFTKLTTCQGDKTCQNASETDNEI